MITKGIIEEIRTPYKVKVRLPFIDKVAYDEDATPTELLSEAVYCAVPQLDPNLKKGDIVFVGFEDNNYSKPIILGYLYRQDNDKTYADLVLNYLKVNNTAILPDNTKIGNINGTEISYLSGVNSNIQTQLNQIRERLNNNDFSSNIIICQPSSQTVNYNINDRYYDVIFNVFSNQSTISYQWQILIDSNWEDISEGTSEIGYFSDFDTNQLKYHPDGEQTIYLRCKLMDSSNISIFYSNIVYCSVIH